jgi:phosphoglycolate phosphatase
MHLIFGFDGTLVDSFDCVVQQFNHLADEYRFNKIDLEQKNELRHLNSKELIALFN